jgi:hypothetical protein
MAALLTLHADARYLSVHSIGAACKGSLSAFASVPLLTNTTISASTTNAALQAAVTAAAPSLHATDRYFAPRVNVGIQLGLYSTELSDARVNGLTTGAGLVGQTWADPNVVQGASYPPV